VGEINQHWEALEGWQSRVAVAKGKKRPGDILVLAEEAPSRVLVFEALRTAADALLRLNRPRFALSVLEQARELDPDDLRARQLEGVALGRAGRYPEARETLGALAKRHRDGETLGLVGRTWKDEWRHDWEAHPQRVADPVAAAGDTAALLRAATEAYADAFRADAANYFPGINALTLGRLWEHVTQRRSTLPLDRIAAGLAWCIEVAVERDKDYWSMASRAELALVEGRKDEAIDAYNDAAALAVTNRDLFALDSSSQQLDLLGALDFRPDIVAPAALVIERAETRLAALGAGPGQRSEPERVVVFSGHMVDDPEVRGIDRGKPPRFPETKVEAAAREIRVRLDAIGAGAGDLGLCGGASGGDLLFAEACLERGMRLELRLARAQPQFMAESVTFADPDHKWERSFARVTGNAATTVLEMPDELGPAPEGVSAHDRCNRWILYSALSHGLNKASFVTLWNGEPGDGPGGTQHMVALVRRLTGRQPEIVDPAKL
jgi:tetratricopeptide (TPR) repeat protein